MDQVQPNSHDLRHLQAKAKQQLSQDDYDYFMYVLNEYWQYRNVDGLVLCLLSVLDTPAKLDLLNEVRDIIDEKDVERFDVVAPFKKMAHPPRAQTTTLQRAAMTEGRTSGQSASSSAQQQRSEATAIRQVTLNRNSNQQTLGFNICGGREHGMGVYVSSVDPASLADRSGLRVGDRLLDVNGMNFEHVAHSTAVKVLKSPGRIVLVVRPAKRPAGSRATQLRVEETTATRRTRSTQDVTDGGAGHTVADGRLSPAGGGSTSELEAHASMHALSELRMGGGSIDVRKVNIPVEPGHPLGIAIRGGKEHDVGIFVSHVEERSVAAKNGLQIGDQIMDVNGMSFLDISHTDAILTLKQNPLLMMTVKAMGRIPLSGHSTDGQLRWLEAVTHDAQDDAAPASRHSPLLRVKNRTQADTDSASGDEQPPPTTTTMTAAAAPAAPVKKESKAKRFQDMLKGATSKKDEDEEEGVFDRGRKPNRGRRRSMTLPSGRSKSLSKAEDDDDDDFGSLRRRPRSRSRNRDDSKKSDVLQESEAKERPSPQPHAKSVGGLSAALGVGQRLVSSMKRRASNSSTTAADVAAVAAIANNQLHKPAAVAEERRGSVTAGRPSPKLRRQDGDGSDASDTRPKDVIKPAVADGASGSPFFSRGLGSQVMLSSMAGQASRQAHLVLEQSAATCMTDAECGALKLHLKRYEDDQSVVDFVTAVLPLLNTSKKVELLRDIRSLVAVQHIQQFDELVSKREVEALMERNRTRPAVGPGAEAKDAKPPPPQSPERGQLFSAIQSGRPQLRKVVSSPSAVGKNTRSRAGAKPNGGLFQGSAALKMLERGRSIDEGQEQRFRRKDSFVDWNDSHEGIRKRGSKKEHSFASEILVELTKTKPKLGISIEGGVDTTQPEVRIQSVIDGGSAQQDGFLQVGFEIVAVDGLAVKGCTHAEAVQRISDAFASQRHILELLIVPEVD